MTTNANDYQYRHKKIYGMLISIFGGVSLIIQFLGYNREVYITQGLFDKYNSTYPTESQTFEWAVHTKTHFGIFEILVLGIVTSIVIFGFILLFKTQKLDGKQAYGDLLIISSYLGIIGFSGFFNDPIMLQRPLNIGWAIAFAIVCGTSAHLLLLHDHLRKQRRLNTSKYTKNDQKWNFLRQAYEIELTEYRNLFHDLIWIIGSLGAGLAFSSILQYTFFLPSAISFSIPFGSIMVFLVVQLAILIFGMILGIIKQLMSEIHDIVGIIRSEAE